MSFMDKKHEKVLKSIRDVLGAQANQERDIRNIIRVRADSAQDRNLSNNSRGVILSMRKIK